MSSSSPQRIANKPNSIHLQNTLTLIQYTFATGFVLGGTVGARKASVRYDATHAHLHPQIRTRHAATHYHRAKQAAIMKALCVEGVRYGGRLTLVGIGWCAVKWAVEGAYKPVISMYEATGQLGEGERAFAKLKGVKDALVGGIVGAAAGFAAGRGQRLFYGTRGALGGTIFGLLIAGTQMIAEYSGEKKDI